MKRRAVALALGLALASCRTAETAPRPAGEPPEVYVPLALGNSWTYQVTDAAGTRTETIKIVGRDGPFFLDDHRGRLRVDAEGVRDSDRYLLRTPIVAGAKWTAVENLVVQRFEIVATDGHLTTPAGGFSRCAVVRNEQPLPQGAGRFVTEWTYAPGVGLVRLRTQIVPTKGAAQEQTRLELVSVHIAQK